MSQFKAGDHVQVENFGHALHKERGVVLRSWGDIVDICTPSRSSVSVLAAFLKVLPTPDTDTSNLPVGTVVGVKDDPEFRGRVVSGPTIPGTDRHAEQYHIQWEAPISIARSITTEEYDNLIPVKKVEVDPFQIGDVVVIQGTGTNFDGAVAQVHGVDGRVCDVRMIGLGPILPLHDSKLELLACVQDVEATTR